MKKVLSKLIIAFCFVFIFSLSSTNVEASNYIRGFVPERTNVRNTPGGKLVGKKEKYEYIEGYKNGKWIKLLDGNYMYDFGIVKGKYVNGFIPVRTNVRSKPSEKLLTSYDKNTYIEGIKNGKWIAFVRNGKLAYLYDFGLKNDTTVTGFLRYSTNMRTTDRSKVIKKLPPLTYISGIKSGKWIYFKYEGKTRAIYDFGLIDGEKVSGYLSRTTNVRNQPSGILLGEFKVNTFIEGVKSGNWIATALGNKIVYVYDFGLKSSINENNQTDNDEEIESDSQDEETENSEVENGNDSQDSQDQNESTSEENMDGDNSNKEAKFYLIESKLAEDSYFPAYEELNVYATAYDALYDINPIKTYMPGDYHIYKTGLNMINITTIKGQPGGWINPTQNRRSSRIKPKANPTEFIEKISPFAEALGKDRDLYASVMIAQAILESGYGTSALGTSPYNNLFGIKGAYEGQSAAIVTFEYDGGEKYEVVAGFKKYPSYYESLLDYVSLLTGDDDTSSWRYNFYKGVRRSQTNSYKDATKYLTGRYATSPTYNEVLNDIIDRYNLTIYDTK